MLACFAQSARARARAHRRGTKVYVEARLGDLLVQRLSPVSVDPATGDFSYESATDNFAVFNVSACVDAVLPPAAVCSMSGRGIVGA